MLTILCMNLTKSQNRRIESICYESLLNIDIITIIGIWAISP